MGFWRYIFRSIFHYSGQHLAVVAATIVSAAVLTGALIVGDSVKLSLLKKVDERLGKTSFVLTSTPNYFRASLAQNFAENGNIASALLFYEGIAINPAEEIRVNKAQILGVDENFWMLSSSSGFEIHDNEAVISENVAAELHLKPGDALLLKLQNAQVIPLNTPFGGNQENSISVRVTVVGIATAEHMGHFSLKNEQNQPANIFLSKEFLSQKLGIEGLANHVLLSSSNESIDITSLNERIKTHWKSEDIALNINSINDSTLEIISPKIFLDTALVNQISQLSYPQEPILTYFANSLKHKGFSTPYSFVSAAQNSFLGIELSNHETIINQWLAEDLNIKPGDSITMSYFVIGPLKTLAEKDIKLVVKEIQSNRSALFSQQVTPQFPGLSTAGNCGDWDAGIPIDLKRIRQKDEDYWDQFKAMPKAFISLENGRQLWSNAYGNATSIRVFASAEQIQQIEQVLMENLNPQEQGLRWIMVKEQGQHAASHGVDFGGLFLSLSFFVAASALILLFLVYKLQLENRSSETGILLALGFSRKRILYLKMAEILPVILLGSLLGAAGGIAYNYMMLKGLNTLWNDAVHTENLEMFIRPQTLMLGMLISAFMAMISTRLVLRKQLKKSTLSIIRKQEITEGPSKQKSDSWVGVGGLILAFMLLLLPLFNVVPAQSPMMLLGGFFTLIGLTGLLSALLRKLESSQKSILTPFSLSLLNARRNQKRSLAVVILLALGSFSVITTGSYRKDFGGSENKPSSGTGGFQFWGETSIPVAENLSTLAGRQALALANEPALEGVDFVQLYSLSGDDASCLNLNQVSQPQIVGVPSEKFDSLGVFSFDNLLNPTQHPWLQLDENWGENTIPAFADQTVIQWGLMKKPGDTLLYFNEQGQPLRLVLAGGLSASIFQGNILIAERQFLKHFPASAGSKIMLLRIPENQITEAKNLLTNSLTDYGLELTETSMRLSNFYSVTNTYLTIFMILGGLGIVLGTLGLALVLIQNMLERKQELFLLRSIGFPQPMILRLIVLENLALLFAGIFMGTISAFYGILPSMLTQSMNIPGLYILALLASVFFSGLLWIYISARLMIIKIKTSGSR